MSDLDHARSLLTMARADLNALKGMLRQDEDYFSDEIFGFHAQQAAEKILKARIASLEGSYSRTHDRWRFLTSYPTWARKSVTSPTSRT